MSQHQTDDQTPNGEAQFHDFRTLDERDLDYLIEKIVRLQEHMIALSDKVIKMQQREIEATRKRLGM